MSKPSLLMSQLKDCLAKAHNDIVKPAVDTHMRHLADTRFPSAGQLSAARARTIEQIKKRLFRNKDFQKLAHYLDTDEDSLEKSLLQAWRFLPEFRVPEPAREEILPAWRLGLVAAIGNVLGVLVLTPVMRLALDMRDLGMLLGGPLGCLVTILLVLWLARHKWVRRVLPFISAGGGLAYIYASVKGNLFPGILRKRFSVKGPLISMAVIAAAWLAKPKVIYNKDTYRDSLHTIISCWLDQAVYLSVAYYCVSRSIPATAPEKEKVLAKLAQYVYALNTASGSDRDAVVQEMTQEARNLGFEGVYKDIADPTTRHKFRWQKDYESDYRTYGQIEEGDMVQIEEPAVTYKGQTIERGLVRKVKNG